MKKGRLRDCAPSVGSGQDSLPVNDNFIGFIGLVSPVLEDVRTCESSVTVSSPSSSTRHKVEFLPQFIRQPGHSVENGVHQFCILSELMEGLDRLDD